MTTIRASAELIEMYIEGQKIESLQNCTNTPVLSPAEIDRIIG
jgi:hypothetical protein